VQQTVEARQQMKKVGGASASKQRMWVIFETNFSGW
jgi:hypothetical protein